MNMNAIATPKIPATTAEPSVIEVQLFADNGEPGHEAAAKARDSLVKVGKRVVNGRGASTDIIEASLKAYLNALNKAAALGKK